MVKRAYGGVALFPSYKKAKVMAQIRTYKRPVATIKPEIKNRVVGLTTRIWGGASNGYSFLCLNDLANGSNQDQRIGRKIKLASMEMDLLFTLGSSVVEYDAGFYSIVYDKRTNGAQPSFSDVYNISGNDGIAVFNETTHPGRFTEISRGEWTVGIAAGWNKKVHKKISLGNRTTEYNNTSASIGSIDGGSLWLICANVDRGTIFADATQIRTVVKIRYVDV